LFPSEYEPSRIWSIYQISIEISKRFTLLSGVARDGTRGGESTGYHKVQTLVIRNRQSVGATYTGESDVYALDSATGIESLANFILNT